MHFRNGCLGNDRVLRQCVLEPTTEEGIVFGRGGGKEDRSEMEILRAGQVFGGHIIDGIKAQLLLDGDESLADIALDVQAVKGRQPPPTVPHVFLVEDDRRQFVDVRLDVVGEVLDALNLTLARQAVTMRTFGEEACGVESQCFEAMSQADHG